MDATKHIMITGLLVISSVISDVYTFETCSSWAYIKTCGDGYYCCNNDTECCSDNVLAVWAIVCIAIGSILFLSCCIAVICCIAKQSQRPGQVIHTVQQPGVAVVAAGQGQPGYGQPMYGQPMSGQPMYGQQPYGQQQYGFQQPASGGKAGTSDSEYPPPVSHPPPMN